MDGGGSWEVTGFLGDEDTGSGRRTTGWEAGNFE